MKTMMWCLAVLTAVTTLAFVDERAAAQAPSAGPAPMTNADVVALTRAGMGDAVIAGAIRQAAASRFDTSVDALITLKSAGISDAVVTAMIEAGSRPAAPLQRAAASEREAGVYIETTPGQLVPLEPTVFSQAKTGGLFTSALTYGIKKAKIKAVVRSPRANIRTTSQRPTLHFHFDRANGSPGAFSGWLASASSPNEFLLVQMSEKRDSRELVVGEMGAFGGSSGARSEDTVPFKVERVATGVYRVVPEEDLGAGEFCLFYSAGAGTLGAGAAGKLFDFGVD